MKYSHIDYKQIIFYYLGAYSSEIDHLERQAQAVYGLPLFGHETIRDLNGYDGKLPERRGWQQALTSLKCGHKSVVVIPRHSDVSEVNSHCKAATLELLLAGAKLVVFIREREAFESSHIASLQDELACGQIGVGQGAVPEVTAKQGAVPEVTAKRGHAVWPQCHLGDLAEVEQAPPQAPPLDGSIEDRPASLPQAKNVEGSAKSKRDAKLPHAPDAPAAGDAQQVWPHLANKVYRQQEHDQNGATATPPSIKSVATLTSQKSHTKTKSVATTASGSAPKTETKKKRFVIRASVSESQKKHFERELPPGISKSYALRHFALERGSWETLEAESFSKGVTRQHSYLMNNIGQIARQKIPGIDAELDDLIKVVNQLPQKKLQPGQRAAKLLDRIKAIGRLLNKVAHYVNATHPEEDRMDRQRIVDELREITDQFKSLLEGGV